MKRIEDIREWSSGRYKEDVYLEKEDTFERHKSYKYPLSAVSTARREWKHSPPIMCGYARECDAIYDIVVDDPKDNILKLGIEIGGAYVECKKRDGRWDIERWFTEQSPLYVYLLYYQTELLMIETKNGSFEQDTGIKIRWKQIIFFDRAIDGNDYHIKYPGGIKMFYSQGLSQTFIPDSCFMPDPDIVWYKNVQEQEKAKSSVEHTNKKARI